MNTKSKKILAGALTACVLLVAFAVEWFIQPGYLIKTIIKVASFGGVMLLYSSMTRTRLSEVIQLRKPERMRPLFLSILLFFVGMGILFFIFRSQINWDGIRQSLVQKEGLTKQNCFFVFAYIIVINSFLEEAFFRGFIPGLFPVKWPGYLIGAILFSVYHIGIIGSWFNLFVFLVCVIGLVFVALFLQWLSIRHNSIVADWLVHAAANLAINVIGTLLIFEVL